MRAVNFVERLQWDITGNVFRHGVVIGDVDNDGNNELVVGTSEGDLYIFKGLELWHKTTGLGLITCVAIGDIFNYGRNALVVICGDGWAHIFYSPRSVHPTTESSTSATEETVENAKLGNLEHTTIGDVDQLSGKMECVHLQRIPTNTKVVLIADVDRDGANEMIIGLTDRVVRSYRWCSNADVGTGKLIGLNKWECANQIGTVTLQHTKDEVPTLLVAQPGGTFMRIKCNPDDCCSEDDVDNRSEAAATCIDYQTLGISQMRNSNISTEIIGDLEPGTIDFSYSSESASKFIFQETNSKDGFSNNNCAELENLKSDSLELKQNYTHFEVRKRSIDSDCDTGKQDVVTNRELIQFYSRGSSSEFDQVDGNIVGGNVILGDFESNSKKSVLPSYEDFSRNAEDKTRTEEKSKVDENNYNKQCLKSKPYAIATLDGTIMLVKDEIILWAMQVDHQIFALCRLDVTGSGADEIIVCAWDGQTYILDQERNSIRFQFEEPVKSFCTGNYSLAPGVSTPSFVYITFTNKIYLYYDIVLPSLTVRCLSPSHIVSAKNREILKKLQDQAADSETSDIIRRLTQYLLYEVDEFSAKFKHV